MRHSHNFAVEREFRRIGVDEDRLGGLAVSGPDAPSPDDFLAWLRSVPAGLGHEAFERRLETLGPARGMAAGGVPPADPSFVYPDIDLRESFYQELERVLPSDMQPANWLIVKLDPATQVPLLRQLPDRAGWDAVAAVLQLGKVVDG